MIREAYSELGSPPPMRGKGEMDKIATEPFRITPAYAGKRYFSIDDCDSLWDHPRLCGEKPDGYYKAKDITGSPPPMRGKAFRGVVGLLSKGITPAYAGKSASECVQLYL